MVQLLSVALMNEPGAFAHVATTLGNAGLNIEAVVGDAQSEVGVARLLVSDPAKGYEVLKEAGHPVQKLEGVMIHIGHTPGALAEKLQALGRAGVNVEFIFGASPDAERGEIVFIVDDVEGAKKALNGH